MPSFVCVKTDNGLPFCSNTTRTANIVSISAERFPWKHLAYLHWPHENLHHYSNKSWIPHMTSYETRTITCKRFNIKFTFSSMQSSLLYIPFISNHFLNTPHLTSMTTLKQIRPIKTDFIPQQTYGRILSCTSSTVHCDRGHKGGIIESNEVQ